MQKAYISIYPGKFTIYFLYHALYPSKITFQKDFFWTITMKRYTLTVLLYTRTEEKVNGTMAVC